MTLIEKQKVFSVMVAKLILEAIDRGYEVTLGEAWRPLQMAEIYASQGKGISNSLHGKRLAVDLNLFRGQTFLRDTEDYRELGEWWEKQSEGEVVCSWGGRFQDGNHFSLAHEGVR